VVSERLTIAQLTTATDIEQLASDNSPQPLTGLPMTRNPRDQVQVKAGNDIYTALAAVAMVVTLIGVITLFVGSSNHFNANLFGETSASGR